MIWPEREYFNKKKQRERLFAKQNGRCMYCGVKLGIEHLVLDHKTPIDRGGHPTSPGNLQLTCGYCNSSKGKLTDGEFRKKYKLTPSRQAKSPPSKPIPRSRFVQISKEIATKKARQRRKEANEWPY